MFLEFVRDESELFLATPPTPYIYKVGTTNYYILTAYNHVQIAIAR